LCAVTTATVGIVVVAACVVVATKLTVTATTSVCVVVVPCAMVAVLVVTCIRRREGRRGVCVPSPGERVRTLAVRAGVVCAEL